MLKALIIEDEERARVLLNGMISSYCDDIEIEGMAENLLDGVKLIHKFKPDIVFLDIEMPLYSGLQILDFFKEEEISFQLIFVTAYSEYAINALQLSAVDYLLKPIVIDDLIAAVEKAKKKRSQAELYQSMQALNHNLHTELSSLKLSLPVSDGLIFVSSDDIIVLQAEGAYTKFFFTNREPILVSKHLKTFEKLLDLSTFFRPSRSHIINLHFVNQFVKRDGGFLVLSDGNEIPIAANKRDEVVRLIEKLK